MGSEVTMNVDGTEGSYNSFFKNAVFTTYVTPAIKSSHPEVLNPSHLDHLHMDRYVPVIIVYRLADNTDGTYKGFVDQLKSSLAKTLVPFYPMAGCVVKTNDLDHPRQFVFNDRGVPFTEVFLDQNMDSFLDLQNFKPVGYLSGFEPAGLNVFKQIQENLEEGNPTFIVQVTRFNCGRIILGITWLHLAADMTAAVQFLTAWSEISRTGTTSIEPYHDRSVLTGHSHSSESSDDSSKAMPPALTAIEAARIEQILKTKYSLKVLHIRKDAIEKVKAEAVQEHPEVSTLDCLCAHLWRSLAKVYATSGISDTTTFTTAVEGRKRMQVSPTYFGNVVTSSSVTGVPASEITSRPLSHAASLIRKAIRGITADTYWNIINQMDLRNPWKTSINRTDYQLGVASWVRFGLFDIDFGVGAPAHISLNLLAACSRKGQCVVLPSSKGEGFFSVYLFLAPNVLDALWADPDFISLS